MTKIAPSSAPPTTSRVSAGAHHLLWRRRPGCRRNRQGDPDNSRKYQSTKRAA
jgi:hypothetical protein